MEKHSFDLWSPQLRNRRTVDVYLPASYGEGRRRYPIVYMQDGQNLSDPSVAFGGNTWRLEDGLTWLAQRGTEVIVVGLWNTPDGSLNTVRSPIRSTAAATATGTSLPDRHGQTPHRRRIPDAQGPRQHRHRRIVDGRTDQPLRLFSPALAFRARRGHESVDLVRWTGDILDFSARPLTRGRIYLDVGTAEGAET